MYDFVSLHALPLANDGRDSVILQEQAEVNNELKLCRMQLLNLADEMSVYKLLSCLIHLYSPAIITISIVHILLLSCLLHILILLCLIHVLLLSCLEHILVLLCL